MKFAAALCALVTAAAANPVPIFVRLAPRASGNSNDGHNLTSTLESDFAGIQSAVDGLNHTLAGFTNSRQSFTPVAHGVSNLSAQINHTISAAKGGSSGAIGLTGGLAVGPIITNLSHHVQDAVNSAVSQKSVFLHAGRAGDIYADLVSLRHQAVALANAVDDLIPSAARDVAAHFGNRIAEDIDRGIAAYRPIASTATTSGVSTASATSSGSSASSTGGGGAAARTTSSKAGAAPTGAVGLGAAGVMAVAAVLAV